MLVSTPADGFWNSLPSTYEIRTRAQHTCAQFVRSVRGAIDAETHLPLKRVITCEENGQTATAIEIYSQLTVNGKIDPKNFEFPEPTGAGSGVTAAEAATSEIDCSKRQRRTGP